jgi:hypothetical protein
MACVLDAISDMQLDPDLQVGQGHSQGPALVQSQREFSCGMAGNPADTAVLPLPTRPQAHAVACLEQQLPAVDVDDLPALVRRAPGRAHGDEGAAASLPHRPGRCTHPLALGFSAQPHPPATLAPLSACPQVPGGQRDAGDGAGPRHRRARRAVLRRAERPAARGARREAEGPRRRARPRRGRGARAAGAGRGAAGVRRSVRGVPESHRLADGCGVAVWEEVADSGGACSPYVWQRRPGQWLGAAACSNADQTRRSPAALAEPRQHRPIDFWVLLLLWQQGAAPGGGAGAHHARAAEACLKRKLLERQAGPRWIEGAIHNHHVRLGAGWGMQQGVALPMALLGEGMACLCPGTALEHAWPLPLCRRSPRTCGSRCRPSPRCGPAPRTRRCARRRASCTAACLWASTARPTARRCCR